ncbi:MAG TPA: hypothetical protein VN875_19260 [Candidatus Binatus sp.]|nr:hypothetical protein [Candidatus Binatus sp.]
MIDNGGLISTERLDSDRYTSLQGLETVLNQAIAQAEISESYEKYLEIFDAFYADDIAVTSDTLQESIRGKARVRSLLANFLSPLHIMSEIGGLLVSIRQAAIPGDVAAETHSAWTLELIGVSGNSCKVSWRVLRQWRSSLVSYEYHYDYEQIGGPLTSKDLYFDAASPPAKTRVS